MSRQRTWYAADALFTSDPKIAELGDRFGPGGPLTIVALHGLAKLGADDGTFETTRGVVARSAFVAPAQVGRILNHAASLGVIDGFIMVDDHAIGGRFPHWTRWQGDRTAADRQRRSREAKDPQEDGRVQAVFDHWQKVMAQPRAKLTPERSKHVRARLRDGYSVEFVCRAVDGCAGSAFHMGDNDRDAKYNDLTLICRNGAKLEQFAASPPPPTPPADNDDDLGDAYR